MTDPAKRERAALDILAPLPEWWAVWPTSYETITGTGEDELTVFTYLALPLDERRKERVEPIDRRGHLGRLVRT